MSSKGTEYDISAVPYGHDAFSDSVASISSNFEVSAKTVKEFFGEATDVAQAATQSHCNNMMLQSLQHNHTIIP